MAVPVWAVGGVVGVGHLQVQRSRGLAEHAHHLVM